jgi:nitroimidazol reductase NimA-like FMN-containing flavoprotein (pyridoxamine 5'-phosphate oxidase superfamily)
VTETAELTVAECLRLLRAGTIGRVVFTSAAMPAAEPVGYILDRDEVVFCVPQDGPLSMATRNAVVGFQADDVDPTTHIGWSVLGIGRTYEVTDPHRRAALAALAADARPWRSDATSRTIALPLQQLSGHQIRLTPLPDTAADSVCSR